MDEVAAIIKANAPVMVYMGLKNLVLLSNELMSRHVPADVPMQIVSRAGHPDQQLFTSSLGKIESDLKRIDPPMPSVILIGTHAHQVNSNSIL